ncbi:primase-helicase family protein [Azomonas macrocytogenes]|uniref:NrS-1 polymerase-like helicase domain-containing protein n=1 Tax=Azomonas macrocytogenes TaxID=69962 RepID=A0A839T7F7_AZOMA|nr:primase-helicase family protein [Azomonas macrocytogenes]MBB3104396.1 hypothetical protein [Azomonas macrocytogenes]
MTDIINMTDTKVARNKIRDRFVRVPSMNGFPAIRDLYADTTHSSVDHLYHHWLGYGGDSKTKPESVLAILNYVDGETFIPLAPRIITDADGVKKVNLWIQPTIKPSGNLVIAEDVPLFIEFLERWLPIEAERDYFVWWIAHVVRKTNRRLVTTLLLRSDHGVGKGFLAETLLPALLGEEAVSVCDIQRLLGHHNEQLLGKVVVLIDEIYQQKKKTVDALKSFQGNYTIPVNPKFRPQINIKNYINFIMSSNDHVPITLEKQDRRFWVPQFIKHKVSQTDTSRFINKQLKPWLENDEGFQKVRDYLETVDLDAFDPSLPPMTDSKYELMGFSSSETLEDLLPDYLKDKEVITIGLIKDRFGNMVHKDISDVSVADVLVKVGCKRRKLDTVRVYITPLGLANGADKINPKELKTRVKDAELAAEPPF